MSQRSLSKHNPIRRHSNTGGHEKPHLLIRWMFPKAFLISKLINQATNQPTKEGTHQIVKYVQAHFVLLCFILLYSSETALFFYFFKQIGGLW